MKLFGFSAGNALLAVAATSSAATALLIPRLFDLGRSRKISTMATAAVIFFNPFAVYLLVGYPEALFVALSIGFFVAWRRESRSVAAFLAGCALLPTVAPQLARDRGGMARQLPTDLAGQETRTVKYLNLVASTLAQVYVGHGQFNLAVKLRRLPHLGRFTEKELHFRMESAWL